MPPLKPMLCRAARQLPPAEEMWFEPKWDGFRAVIFRDGDEVEIQSRHGRPLTRYFPELIPPMRDQLPPRCVLDGELVIATDHGLDFDALGQRIHPAESRVQRLAGETPAALVAFDLVAEGDQSWLNRTFTERRQRLETVARTWHAPLHLSPITADRDLATDWFVRFEGAGLDGVVAKPADAPYQPDQRTMIKVKHRRTADCVVTGFRIHKSGTGVGSLLLGLYDRTGTLNHVGVAASFSEALRQQLALDLEPLTAGGSDQPPQSRPASRWDAGKDLSFIPVRLERVAEVAYEHRQGNRFRHTTRFLRWRPDRSVSSCTFDQLERIPPVELGQIFNPNA